MQPPYGETTGLTKEQKEKMVKSLLKQYQEEQKEKQDQADASSAVWTILALGILNAISWVVPLFLWGWHHKSFVSVGAKIFTVNTHVTKFNISVKCGKNKLEDLICHLLNKTAGEYELREIMDYACLTQGHAARALAMPMGHMLCYMMQLEFYAAMIPIIAYPLCTVLYLSGVFMLFFYWHVSHKKSHRAWASALFLIAPLVGIGGFLAWTFIAPDLSELPLALTGGPSSPLGVLLSSVGVAGGSGLGAEVFDVDFGMAWFVTLGCIFWSLVTACMLGVFLRPREDEIEGSSKEDDTQLDAAGNEAAAGPVGPLNPAVAI
mmetsp:Transcript_2616/g.6722  ORF Transcript_2616/g.6722 Transcript_2616/m.6722 type:complete len:320 (-) Transcript_2616:35-994(-)